MKEEIMKIITTIAPELEVLKLEDTSYKHAHHGHGFSGNSHFEVELLSKGLGVLQKVALQKKLTQGLAPLYSREKVHSISIKVE